MEAIINRNCAKIAIDQLCIQDTEEGQKKSHVELCYLLDAVMNL